MSSPGIVNIHGKEYETVASRVGRFREDHPDHTIETQLIKEDETKVIMKALILDGDRLLATGYAEEIRGSSNINQTSALENCETSAIGRCLAALGYMGTDSYATADEVATAIKQQHEKQILDQWAAHTQMVEEHHDTLIAIRGFLAEDNFDAAREAWNEVSNDDKMILWRATTKGGWFTPRERQQMKWWSNDFEKGRKE